MEENTNTTTATTEKTKFCKHCGGKIPEDAVLCTLCGRQVETMQQQTATPTITINNSNANVNANVNANIAGKGPKAVNKWIALLLCFFFGFLGAHKFYEGRTGLGIIYLLTFGLCGFGWGIDTIVLLFKPNVYYV